MSQSSRALSPHIGYVEAIAAPLLTQKVDRIAKQSRWNGPVSLVLPRRAIEYGKGRYLHSKHVSTEQLIKGYAYD
jgi:hypothetical protein